ncbi:MAG: hypothetical protein LBG58_15155 [Planctomycetaceae bacterium]|nr:hypothetical protein [Planctomycetaceae bacterium]
MNCDLFDFVIDYDFLNHSLHSIIEIIVQTITRRVAAGWLVLPFQGERITVTIDCHTQTENAPIRNQSINQSINQ